MESTNTFKGLTERSENRIECNLFKAALVIESAGELHKAFLTDLQKKYSVKTDNLDSSGQAVNAFVKQAIVHVADYGWPMMDKGEQLKPYSLSGAVKAQKGFKKDPLFIAVNRFRSWLNDNKATLFPDLYKLERQAVKDNGGDNKADKQETDTEKGQRVAKEHAVAERDQLQAQLDAITKVVVSVDKKAKKAELEQVITQIQHILAGNK